MELWIRSQDKDILLKVDSLLIDDNNNDIYTQCWVGVNLETYTLGKYKTKERALEVLNEIQEKLKVIMTNEAGVEYILARHLVPIIYEMPQD